MVLQDRVKSLFFVGMAGPLMKVMWLEGKKVEAGDNPLAQSRIAY